MGRQDPRDLVEEQVEVVSKGPMMFSSVMGMVGFGDIE